MTISVANVLTTDTFSAWLNKTNVIATIVSQNTVTVDGSSTGSVSTGNAVVNGFFTANTLVTRDALVLNSVVHQVAKTYTFSSSTAAANIDVVALTTYRSYEYSVQLSDTSLATPRYQATKISILHDGTSAYMTEYGTLLSGLSLGSFDAIIGGGNIALQLTPATSNVVAKFIRTSIVP